MNELDDSMVPNYPAGNDQAVGRPGPLGRREIDDAWIHEHYGRIHRAAWLMTGDRWEAEDLAQETFVVALERWGKFEGRSSESTWLYGILIRLSLRRGRSLARMRRRLMKYAQRNGWGQAVDERPDDPQAVVAAEQWRQSVWADVARLPAAQRVAVTLRFAQEMSYQQIAETIGCATSTAKTRVHHGLRRLRQSLDLSPLDESSSAQRRVSVQAECPAFESTMNQPSIHIASRP